MWDNPPVSMEIVVTFGFSKSSGLIFGGECKALHMRMMMSLGTRRKETTVAVGTLASTRKIVFKPTSYNSRFSTLITNLEMATIFVMCNCKMDETILNPI